MLITVIGCKEYGMNNMDCGSELPLYTGEHCSPIRASVLARRKAKATRSHSKFSLTTFFPHQTKSIEWSCNYSRTIFYFDNCIRHNLFDFSL
jgi:hypothetical protein